MSYFTTRVELHDAKTYLDYEELHTEMAKEGFSRTIKLDNDATVYQLPTAEYNKYGDFSAKVVLESAKRAATKTGKKFSVLVTKTEERREWYNLLTAKASKF